MTRYARRLAAWILTVVVLMPAAPAQAGWKTLPGGAGVLGFHVYTPAGGDATYARAVGVVLHGCKQTARAFAEHTGWTKVADDFNLILLAPEFGSVFRDRCFNWYGDDVVPSRSQMTAEIRRTLGDLTRAESVDKVFFTGLSAGGAMASALLAKSLSWDEVKPIGAGVVAGVVYGCTDVIDADVTGLPGLDDATAALVCMGDTASGQEKAWDALRKRSRQFITFVGSHRDRGLKLSLWHGVRDTRVDPINADVAALQWAHTLGLKAPRRPKGMVLDGAAFPPSRLPYAYESTANPAKGQAVETWLIKDMGHRWPINASGDGYRCGSPSPGDDHYEEAGLCAAYWIAKTVVGLPKP